jgi:hypothetical protein
MLQRSQVSMAGRFTARGVNRSVADRRSSGIVIHRIVLAPGINVDGHGIP